MFRNANSRAQLLEAARLIDAAITWVSTPQGVQYWIDVMQHINDLAAAAPSSSPVTAQANTVSGSFPEPVAQKIILLHIYDNGQSLCGLKGDPAKWAPGNHFVRITEKNRATCSFCKSKAPL